MCGRFTVFDDSHIPELENIIRDVQEKYHRQDYKTGEVFPSDKAVTIVANQGVRIGTVMQWGFPKWDGKGIIINARSETAAEKKTFMQPLRKTRCVIPTTGFYEWDKEKRKYLFTHKEDEKNPVVYLAGIYNFFNNKDTEYSAFTIFTRDANESIRNIHNRMPVILYRNEIDDYLNDEKFAAYAFQRGDIKLKGRVD